MHSREATDLPLGYQPSGTIFNINLKKQFCCTWYKTLLCRGSWVYLVRSGGVRPGAEYPTEFDDSLQ